MCFRVRNEKLVSTFEIAIVRLDSQLNVISPPQILDIRSHTLNKYHKQQDPKLISVGEQLYVIYSNDVEIEEQENTFVTRRVFVAKVNFDGVAFGVELPECILTFEGMKNWRWEKNWVPFEYNNCLMLAYSLFPHKIFKFIEGLNACKTISVSQKKIDWPWGELRGGTPALKLNDNQYLAFFHSSIKVITSHSKDVEVPHYVMGAYVFDSEPPFAITHISPQPIIASGFYSGQSYKTWRPVCVVFPGGFIMDDRYIWIAYGRQDHEMWIVKLDKQGLLDSLIPVDGF